MSVDPIDDVIISDEHLLSEQHLHINNQQNEKSAENQSNSESIANVTRKKMNPPMNPTPLEYSCWSTHPTATAVCVFILYIGVTMTIGILIVGFTSPNAKIQSCQLSFKITAQNPIEYNYGPRWVAAGDFNNDTYLDLAVANSAMDNIGIFFGYGNGTIASQMTYSTGVGSAPNMIAVGDFNNDDRLDIAVANFGTNNIGILLGFGNGSFMSQTTFSTASSRPIWIDITDLNKDQVLDILTANYGTHSISILYGYGNGIFSHPLTYWMGYDSSPFAVVAGDFNNDDQIDLAVANYGTNNIGLLFGSGNNTFENQTAFSVGHDCHPYALAVGHFNQDTILDIAVINHGNNSIGIFLGCGNGTFLSHKTYLTDSDSPYSIVVTDFNNDSRLDLIVTNNGINNIGVFFGYGSGVFESPKLYSTGSSFTTSVTVGDFNNDNRLDISVTNIDTNSVGILLGHDQGSFGNQMRYTTGASPSSVAVGDFNADGYLDIVVANWNNDTVSILLGYGNGSFSNQMNYATGTSPYSVAVGEFNDDGYLDIVVANFGNSTVSILLGCSNGSFGNQTRYTIGASPSSVAVGDFNADGYLDIVVANWDNDTVSILLGYGNGSFGNPTMYPLGYGMYPQSVVVGDFNDDTNLDIVVANTFADNVAILFGYGNGSFGILTMYSTDSDSYPLYVAVADFNNDGQLDIAVANCYDSSVGVLLGYGNGAFSIMRRISLPSFYPSSIGIGDFNNDTRLDIVVGYYYSNNVSVLLGDGNGFFGNIRNYTTGSSPFSVAVGDFNNDNRLDIVAANFDENDVSVLLYYNEGALLNETAFAFGGGSRLQYAAIGDFSNDNKLDIVVANYGTDNIGLLHEYGNGTFERQKLLSTKSSSHPYSVAVGDLNSDTKMDIVVANMWANNVGIFPGYGNGSFADEMTYSTNYNPYSVAVGDFNNDRLTDIVVAYNNIDNVDILAAYETVTLGDPTTYSTGSEPRSISVGDFNNDHRLDMVVANYGNNTVDLLLGYGNGFFAKRMSYSTGSQPISVAVGDFNNDQQLDIVVANYGDNNIGVLLGYGNGSFAIQTTFSSGNSSKPYFVAVADFNDDGHLDIAVANYGTFNVGIFLGYGNGFFANILLLWSSWFPEIVTITVGDLNNDHRTDIVITNPNLNSIEILLGYGNGSFSEQQPYSTGSNPYALVGSNPQSVVVGDFNNDTNLDIVVANTFDDNVAILLGYGDGSFTEQTLYATGSYPQSVAVGDFNNDKQLDIVVANYHDNTVCVLLGYGNGSFADRKTYSTGSRPISVSVGDFNNDNWLDISTTNFLSDSVSVLLGNKSIAFEKQMMLETGNGSRPRAFAISDFNNDGRTDIGIVNSGTNNIGIFLGQNQSSFENQQTFSIGSFPYSVAVGDLNNDTRLDLVVANFGSNNLGVLLGYGNGSFANQTTYAADSRPQSVAIADFNNDTLLDIIVAIHDTNNVGVLLGYGNGTFAAVRMISIGYGSHPFFVVVGDFNNDRKLDFAVANNDTDSLNIFLQTCN